MRITILVVSIITGALIFFYFQNLILLTLFSIIGIYFLISILLESVDYKEEQNKLNEKFYDTFKSAIENKTAKEEDIEFWLKNRVQQFDKLRIQLIIYSGAVLIALANLAFNPEALSKAVLGYFSPNLVGIGNLVIITVILAGMISFVFKILPQEILLLQGSKLAVYQVYFRMKLYLKSQEEKK